jgi:hypothetical protein
VPGLVELVLRIHTDEMANASGQTNRDRAGAAADVEQV